MTRAKRLLFEIAQAQPQTNIVVSDDFNRADNATTLGNALTNQSWIYTNSVWGISGNKAYSVTSTTAHKRALIDSGIANGTIQVKIDTYAADSGIRLIFRYADQSNEWLILDSSRKYSVARRIGGTLTTLFNSSVMCTSGDVIKVVCNGVNIKCYINDVLLYELNDASLQSATIHGFEIYTGNGSRFDDFKVESL